MERRNSDVLLLLAPFCRQEKRVVSGTQTLSDCSPEKINKHKIGGENEEKSGEKICENMQHSCCRRYKFKCNRITRKQQMYEMQHSGMGFRVSLGNLCGMLYGVRWLPNLNLPRSNITATI